MGTVLSEKGEEVSWRRSWWFHVWAPLHLCVRGEPRYSGGLGAPLGGSGERKPVCEAVHGDRRPTFLLHLRKEIQRVAPYPIICLIN